MRALVAGGVGLLGSNLCAALLRAGDQVICLDNLSTGRPENLAPLLTHRRFRFIHHDIVRGLPALPALDAVYHLASPASPPGYSRWPIETLRANSEGTLRLLELAHLHRARFLYASTSEVYGDPLCHPQSEDYRGNVSSIGPRSMYDEAKRFGEAMTVAFVRNRSLEGRIVRIFNTYGPGADPDDGRLASNLIVQALCQEPMTIYGNGMQTRSLCYVTDTVAGLRAAMDSPRAAREVINLGNPDEHTVLEFAELIRTLTGTTSEFVFRPPAVGDDPQMRCPDIRKARELLGWGPRVGLREGLVRTITHFRHVLDAPSPTPSTARPAAMRPVNGHHYEPPHPVPQPGTLPPA